MDSDANNAGFGTTRPYTVVHVVPTDTGPFSFSGGQSYTSQALPITRCLARVADRVVTTPNAISGTQLYWPLDNVMVTEPYALDKFSAGEWGLRPVYQNRIGVVIDQAMAPGLRTRMLKACDASVHMLGVDIAGYVMTDAPLGILANPAGDTLDPNTPLGVPKWGSIGNPGSMLRAAEYLIRYARVQAILVISRYPDDIEAEALEAYHRGRGANPLAGVEAIIRNLVVKTFRIPCGHAPALLADGMAAYLNRRRRRRDARRAGSAANTTDDRLDSLDDFSIYQTTYSRRKGNKYPFGPNDDVAYTFLPSVLAALSRSPQMVDPTVSASEFIAPRIRKQPGLIDPFEFKTEYDSKPPIVGSPKQRRSMMDNINPWEYLAHSISRTGDVYNTSVDALVLPDSSFGGIGVLNYCNDPRVKIITVEDFRNYDRDLTAGVSTEWNVNRMGARVERARNYMEAVGMIAAHKAAVSSQSLHPSLGRIPDLGYIYATQPDDMRTLPSS